MPMLSRNSTGSTNEENTDACHSRRYSARCRSSTATVGRTARGAAEEAGVGAVEGAAPVAVVMSVHQRPAGEVEEHVLQGGAAHQSAGRRQAAAVHLGQGRVAVVDVDEHPVGQRVDPL